MNEIESKITSFLIVKICGLKWLIMAMMKKLVMMMLMMVRMMMMMKIGELKELSCVDGEMGRR